MAAKVETAPCDARLTKILMAQYKLLMTKPSENLIACIDPADIRVWYFLAVGLDDPYLGGEFLFKLTAPNEFPHKPPSFEFCTPNGVYQPGGPICISVGEFHAEDRPGKDGSHGWRPSLGMVGFATEVVNGMICWECLESGIRIVNQPAALKRVYARSSREQNLRMYPHIVKALEEVIQSMPDTLPVLNIRDARLRLAGKPIPPRSKKPALIEPSGSVSQPPVAKLNTQASPAAHSPVQPQAPPARPSVASAKTMSYVSFGNASKSSPGMQPTPPEGGALSPPAMVSSSMEQTPLIVAPVSQPAPAPVGTGPPVKPRGDNLADFTDLLTDLLADEVSASEEGDGPLEFSAPPGPLAPPTPAAEKVPVPAPVTTPAPVPAPAPAPVPTTAPLPITAPVPVPAPAPAPITAPIPAPAPIKAPTPEPVPTPIPAPAPALPPVQAPAPAPTSAPPPAPDDSEELVVVPAAGAGKDTDMDSLLNDLLKDD